MLERYFDNAATTPIDPRVLEEMLPFLHEEFGNAHSIHSFGRKARAVVEQARERAAYLIGAEDPSQVIFTSGATESNNWVLRSFPTGFVSPYEHSSVLEPARALGFQTLNPTCFAFEAPGHPTELLSIMSVNNETGTIWDVRDWTVFSEKLHTDATQAVGKIPVNLDSLDYLSFSSHKIYGPKGVGALYGANPQLSPLIMGGEQENGLRGGTLNVAAIVGFGAAANIALNEREQDVLHANALRHAILESLQGVSDWQVNGGPFVSPFILSVSFAGLEGETLVVEMDRQGFAISSGAACSSRSTEPSHVLRAFGLSPEWLRGTVRISVGRFNTLDSAVNLGQSLLQSVEILRTMSCNRL